MPTATPTYFMFDARRIGNKLLVKLPVSTIALESVTLDDGTNSILPLFEVIGAGELASIARHDQVGGVSLAYQITGQDDDLTKKLTAKLLATGAGDVVAAAPDSIDISKYISPTDLTDDTLPGILINEEGDLMISLLMLGEDELVEIQTLSGGKMINIVYGLEDEE